MDARPCHLRAFGGCGAVWVAGEGGVRRREVEVRVGTPHESRFLGLLFQVGLKEYARRRIRLVVRSEWRK